MWGVELLIITDLHETVEGGRVKSPWSSFSHAEALVNERCARYIDVPAC